MRSGRGAGLTGHADEMSSLILDKSFLAAVPVVEPAADWQFASTGIYLILYRPIANLPQVDNLPHAS